MAWFSDWGGTKWAEDVEVARKQARAWIDRAAAAKGWTDAQHEYALALTDRAAEDADDATDYWRTLAGLWPAQAAVAGWDKLGATFASAGGTATSTAAARSTGTVGAVVGGTVGKTAEDVAGAAEVTKSALSNRWLVGGVVVGLLAVGVAVVAWKHG